MTRQFLLPNPKLRRHHHGGLNRRGTGHRTHRRGNIAAVRDEERLAIKIRELWIEHTEAKITVTKTRDELKAIRKRLAEHLSQMKQLLVKTGRGGGWSSFLRAERIAKATADRLVRRHQESGVQETNVVTEQVSELGETDIQHFFESVMPALKKKLTTPRLAFDFLLWFVPSFELAHEWKENGLLVLKPSVKAATETSIAAAPLEDGSADSNKGDVQ